MRTALDRLYMAGGALAALFLVLICALVTAQVILNLIDMTASALTGSAFGLTIPSYSDFAGFFLAASSFLALAYTFRDGAHIRVSLMLQALPPFWQWLCDLLSVAIALAFAAYFTWYAGLLALESWEYGDVSTGMIPVALWIPQSAVVLGLAVLTIALLDDLVALLARREPSFAGKDDGVLAEAGSRAE